MRTLLTLAACVLAVHAIAQEAPAPPEKPAEAAATAAPGPPPMDASPSDASLILGAIDGYADSAGTKIHFVSLGQGPLIVFIHGFPDFWYSWRHQMKDLSANYRCVAMDQRGFNLSDKPEGQENYAVEKLVGDVAAVVKACGVEKAAIVGHDLADSSRGRSLHSNRKLSIASSCATYRTPKGFPANSRTIPSNKK